MYVYYYTAGKKKPNRVSFGSIWIRIWVHLEKPGQNREWSSQGWNGTIGFQMHPRAPLWVHLVFPNAPKCRFSQIHPNAWCSKCIQMNNRSVENERSVENRSVGIWYLFRHPHQHHSIIACITWNHNQSSWFLIWWRLGSEKDTFQQGFNMSTDLFSFSTDLLFIWMHLESAFGCIWNSAFGCIWNSAFGCIWNSTLKLQILK